MSAKVMETRVLAGLRAWHQDESLTWTDFDGDGIDHRKLMQLAIEAADKARGGEAVAVVGIDGYPHWLAEFLSGTKWADTCKPGTKLYTHPAPASGEGQQGDEQAVAGRAAIWIEFTEGGERIRFWTSDQDRATEEAFCHARQLTAFYAKPPAHGGVDALIAAAQPFATFNSGDEFIDIRVPTSAVTALRAALAQAGPASGEGQQGCGCDATCQDKGHGNCRYEGGSHE